MATEKQVIANRLNAQKSTGAINTENTKYNAITHSLTSKHITQKEDLEEINSLSEIIRAQIEPQNIFEEIALSRIIISIWKLNKILQIQSKDFYNGEKKANESLSFESFTNNELIACTKLSSNSEALQRYEVNAENSLHKSMNLIFRIRKEKLGSFLQK
jgi:hypothetical protein